MVKSDANPNVMVVELDDALAALQRIFAGEPHPDDANLLRAVADLGEGTLDDKEIPKRPPPTSTRPLFGYRKGLGGRKE